VAWAIHCGQASPLKIVLTAGSALELREKYRDVAWRGEKGVPFYFDQRGLVLSSLSRYYGIEIRSVPVRMTQQSNGLRLDYGMGATP
jgi:conjugal transfer pilus assembly protein TraW